MDSRSERWARIKAIFDEVSDAPTERRHSLVLELTGGDAALTEFLAQHRDGDAQRLRQLVRLASRDPTSSRGKGAARDLLRSIRELGEDAAAATGEGAAELEEETEDGDA